MPSDGLSVEIDGQTVARAETREAIQKLLDSLDVVSRDRARLEELRQPLPELRHQAKELLIAYCFRHGSLVGALLPRRDHGLAAWRPADFCCPLARFALDHDQPPARATTTRQRTFASW